MQQRRSYSKPVVLVVLLILLILADLLWGPRQMSLSVLWDPNPDDLLVLKQFRIPKTLVAAFAGMGLAICGLIMQTLFRNPLAGPYVLGLSSGASLTVGLCLMAFPLAGVGMAHFGLTGAAMLGSLFVLILIWAVSRVFTGSASLLLFGIILGQLLSAVQGIFSYIARPGDLKLFAIWSLGSFSQATLQQAISLGVLVMILFLFIWRRYKALNLYEAGEEYATLLGVNIRRFVWFMVLICGCLTGYITALCGPIGFIGMAVPNAVRLFTRKADHMVLVPATAVAGAVLALICDTLSYLPILQFQMPINVVTSIIGGPFVIWIILKQLRWHGN